MLNTGIEVLDALVQGYFANYKNEFGFLSLFAALAACKRYDPKLSIRDQDHKQSVKHILGKVRYLLSISFICILIHYKNYQNHGEVLPKLDLVQGEWENSHPHGSDFYTLITQATAELAVSNILAASGVQNPALKLQTLCAIPWKNDRASDFVSFLFHLTFFYSFFHI
jgi:hypothetical protein